MSNDISFESHPEYARIHAQYKRFTLKDLENAIREMLASAKQGIAQGEREFDGRGGRRYGPAMAHQGGVEEAQEARLLKLYLEERVEKCLLIGQLCEACEEETSEDYRYLQDLLAQEKSELGIWRPTQSVDGATGAISWRVFRYVMSETNGNEVRTREYARTEETDTDAIAEFTARSDAQAHCDKLNGHEYVSDDSEGYKISRGEQRTPKRKYEKLASQTAITRPRNEKMTPEALAAALSDD